MSNELPNEKKSFDAKAFFTNKKNIASLVAIFFGLLAVVMFLVLPVVQITLTPDGKALAEKNAETIPEMAKYHEVLGGIKVLFGIGSYSVWHNVTTSAVLEVQKLAFNVPILIGLVLVLGASIALAVLLILKKNNIINKFILGAYIVGAVLILLTPVWFYMVTPITASTRYDTTLTIYPYGSINAHAAVGMILSFLFAIVGAVASGLLIVRKDDNAR